MTNSHEIILDAALSTAKTLQSIPAGVRSAFIQPVGGAVYYWLDGTTPTNDGASGHILANGLSILLLQGEDVRGFKVIKKSGDTVNLMVSYQGP